MAIRSRLRRWTKCSSHLTMPKLAGAILGVPMADASRFGTISQNANGELAGLQ